MLHYSDHAIVEGLRLNSDYIIRYIYQEYFPTIRYLVKTNGGAEEDVEDIFQESLLIILQKIRQEDFELQSTFLTFLYSISKNLWLQKLKKQRTIERNHSQLVHFLSSPEIGIEVHIEDNEKYKLFIKHFENLGEDCRKLLLLFLQKNSLREIAYDLGYSSEMYAKTKKYLCKEALKKMIESDPEMQSIL
jgi:RNA polymerase sigma factor (sigma-70 family)